MTGRAATGVFSLGLANALALLAAVAAAALYGRWLDAAAFAHWAMALAIARAGLLLLDGGLKTALVRHVDEPDARTLRSLARWSAAAAGLLSVLTAVVCVTLLARGRLTVGEAGLLFAYPAAYLLSYPLLFTALARLERAQCFGPIGRAEGLSVAVEFVLPAALLAFDTPYWAAFAAAVVLARGLRTAWIRVAARGLGPAPSNTGAPRPAAMLKQGLALQAVAGLSLLRDQMHLWLLAPWFGALWAGQYSLAFTACALASQVGVQTAARVGLPALRATPPALQWPMVLDRTRRLAIATLPPLALLPAWLGALDSLAWDGRWQAAVGLVPWLALRMLAGVATTGLGAWLMVAREPWRTARAHAAWTLFEVAAAAAALGLWGPSGLAYATAFTVWAGVGLFLAAASPAAEVRPRWQELLAVLLLRPSLASALALGLWVAVSPSALPVATGLLGLCWCTEAPVRRWLRHRLVEALAGRAWS